MLAQYFMLCQFKKGNYNGAKFGKLLGGDAKKRRALTELRQMTRDDSDVRLIAEILARAHSIIRSLGLDPSNATDGRNLSITNGYCAEGGQMGAV